MHQCNQRRQSTGPPAQSPQCVCGSQHFVHGRSFRPVPGTPGPAPTQPPAPPSIPHASPHTQLVPPFQPRMTPRNVVSTHLRSNLSFAVPKVPAGQARLPVCLSQAASCHLTLPGSCLSSCRSPAPAQASGGHAAVCRPRWNVSSAPSPGDDLPGPWSLPVRGRGHGKGRGWQRCTGGLGDLHVCGRHSRTQGGGGRPWNSEGSRAHPVSHRLGRDPRSASTGEQPGLLSCGVLWGQLRVSGVRC